MTSLKRRLQKLETRRWGGQEFIIVVEYVNEPPKSYIAEREGRLEYGPSVHDPSRVMTIRLTEDDLRL